MTTWNREGGPWLSLSYGYGIGVALVLGYFLLRIPIQVGDAFSDLLVMRRSFTDMLAEAFQQAAYLRPARIAVIRLVAEASGGNYFNWFRLTHVAQVIVLIVLFIRLLRPATAAAAVVLPLALAVLIGSHTFAWTVREALPINHFLTIVICCVGAANLAFTGHRWWTDLLAAGLFVFAVLTIESGVLVWVILAGGYAVGGRGVSRRGVAIVTALLVSYVALRFGVLGTGLPDLTYREAGFGFRRYDSSELQAMFGASPVPFYAYNVVASVLGLLIAEPRDGVWYLTRSIVSGEPDYVLLMAAAASTVGAALILQHVWRSRARLARHPTYGDQLVLLFMAVTAANALLSYAYTKDVIMSPAGAFFALAVFAASRDLVERTAHTKKYATVVVAIGLCLFSTAWAMRAVGLHAALANTAVQVREQWVHIDDRVRAWGYADDDTFVHELKRELQDDALLRHPRPPILLDEVTQFFEID